MVPCLLFPCLCRIRIRGCGCCLRKILGDAASWSDGSRTSHLKDTYEFVCTLLASVTWFLGRLWSRLLGSWNLRSGWLHSDNWSRLSSRWLDSDSGRLWRRNSSVGWCRSSSRRWGRCSTVVWSGCSSISRG